MKRISGRFALAAGLGVSAAAAVAAWAAGEAGLVLFDAPRGAWLAEVRPDAPVVVIEERDGWRHVRVEGWIPAREGSPAPAGGAAAASGSAPTAARIAVAPAGSGASVRGVLAPRPGMTPSTVGANLVVILVGDLERLDAEQASIGERCQITIQDFDRQLAEIQIRLNTALNSTNNFTEASRRSDRAKADRAAATSGRAAALKACFDQSDALYDRYALARVGSDTTGQYEFRGVADGVYRIVARDRAAGTTRVWALPCAVAGGAPITIDAVTAPAAPDPYWSLR
jgi:hypothetical protein